jgi:DNA-binding SARP family transcriptional activator
MFWARSEQSRARQALRQNLTRLRDLLGQEAFEDRGSELRLVCPLASDFDDFHTALQRGDLEGALAVYAGSFFPDYGAPGSAEFEHWLDAERERIRNLYLRAGERVVRRGLDSGRPRDVVELAVRLRKEAPDSEGIRRLHIELLIELRDTPSAEAAADELLRWLKEERRGPEPATGKLIQRVREGKSEVEEKEVSRVLVADLVGRAREFSRIVGAWGEVVRGPARQLHIEGRAGLGKSRLLEEVADRMRTLGGTVLPVRAQSGEQHLDNAFVADLALALAALPGAKAVSGRTSALLVGLHPALGAAYPRVVAEDAGADRVHQRGLAIAELMISIAEEAPFALLIDDVHWIDPESRKIVGAAIARTGKAHLLMVTSGRPGGDVSVSTDAERVLLNPLTLGDTEELLTSMGSFADSSLGRRLGAALHRSSGGSPLLMLESVQLAIENCTLLNEAGVWQVPNQDALLKWLEQRDALESRLNSLSPNARQVLLTLAATGVPVARKDLARALESGALSGDTLAELERRGYLAPRGDRLDLAHAEIGAAILRLAPDGARKAAHAGLGRALLDRNSGETHVARRAARHLMEAGADRELERLFRSWVNGARARNDWVPADKLADELLGDLADSGRVRVLVRSLPSGLRWPIRRWGISAIGLLLLLVGLAVLLFR